MFQVFSDSRKRPMQLNSHLKGQFIWRFYSSLFQIPPLKVVFNERKRSYERPRNATASFNGADAGRGAQQRPPFASTTGSLMARRQAGFRHISKSSRQVWSICPGRDSLGRPTGLCTQGCLAKKQPDGQDHSRGSELGARKARVGGPGLRK